MLVLFIAAASLIVYLDATRLKIGKTDAGGMFNLSAGAWAICTLLIFIVALPAYLLKRSSLKTIAAENPRTVKARGLKATIIAVIGFGWAFAVLYADYLERIGNL